MSALNVGSKAPDFTLLTGDGKKLTLNELKGKKVILYFYSKDNTPGCTREACSFQDNISAIQRKGAVVVGVSTDSSTSHKNFAAKYQLSFPLVSDDQKQVVKKYGVWKEKSLYGKKFMGTERTTFLIDETGTITHIFSKVKVDGHTEEILKTI